MDILKQMVVEMKLNEKVKFVFGVAPDGSFIGVISETLGNAESLKIDQLME